MSVTHIISLLFLVTAFFSHRNLLPPLIQSIIAIDFFAFQGHLLELLGRLGAGVNRKVFAPQGQIIPCFS